MRATAPRGGIDAEQRPVDRGPSRIAVQGNRECARTGGDRPGVTRHRHRGGHPARRLRRAGVARRQQDGAADGADGQEAPTTAIRNRRRSPFSRRRRCRVHRADHAITAGACRREWESAWVRLGWRSRRERASPGIPERSERRAEEQALGLESEQVGHAPGEGAGVCVQALVAVEEVLKRVVGRVADVRLGIDHEPGFTLRGEHVLRVEVGAQQDVPVGSRRQRAKQCDPSRARPGSRLTDRPAAF